MKERLVTELSFSYSRSSGPGGQNVNKVNSKVRLHWNIHASTLLTYDQKRRLLHHAELDSDGNVMVTSSLTRDQSRNKEDCIEKLLSMIERSLIPPKKRRATRPSKGSVERRLSSKKKHSHQKKNRKFSTEL